MEIRPRIETAERRRRIAMRHHLAAPHRCATLEPVAAAQVGLHSSDPASVYLSAWARTTAAGPEPVASALYDRRSLLRVTGMRRTMFVVTREHTALLHHACAGPLASRERARLVKMIEEQGVAANGLAWLAEVEEKTLAALDARGEAVARQLGSDVPELKQKLRFGGAAKWAGEVAISTRVLFLLATTGRIIRSKPRGTWISSQYRWTSMERWLGAPIPELDGAEARRELARAWLRTYGPATLTDLKWWTGWTVRHTRAALADLAAVEVDLDTGTGWVLPDDLDPTPAPDPWVALLPGLDPTTMGWKEREWFLGDYEPRLFDRNGNGGPMIWADGRVVGGWAQLASGEVVTELFEPISDEHHRLLKWEVSRLSESLGDMVVTPRFRTPLEKRLVEAGAD